jgi:hypothetical protein
MYVCHTLPKSDFPKTRNIPVRWRQIHWRHLKLHNPTRKLVCANTNTRSARRENSTKRIEERAADQVSLCSALANASQGVYNSVLKARLPPVYYCAHNSDVYTYKLCTAQCAQSRSNNLPCSQGDKLDVHSPRTIISIVKLRAYS